MPIFTGTANDDVITGSAGNDVITGLEGNDTIDGGPGDDEITGGPGNDTINGGTGFNDFAIYAGNRADYLISTSGMITITGLGIRAIDGVDTLRNVEWARFADVTVSLGVNTNNPPFLGQPAMVDQIILDSVSYRYQIPGTSFIELDQQVLNFRADLVNGQPLPSWLLFNGATRTFSGLPPIATINAVYDIRVTADDGEYSISDSFVLSIAQAPGVDITGTANADQLGGTFRNETMIGLAGNDLFFGSVGADRIDGGAGTDTVSYRLSFSGVNVNLLSGEGRGGDAEGDFLISIENVYGSAFADVIVSGAGNDILFGFEGDDVIDGGSGNNVIVGGAGNDTITVTDAFNEIYGGTGNDVFIIASRTDSIVEAVDEGVDEVRTTLGTYELASNIENLVLLDSAAHGAIIGNAGNNVIVGGAGYDEIYARAGNDILIGATGAANALFGQQGDDVYVVGAQGDSTIELPGEGIDTVQTALSALVLRDNVENLLYTGNAGFTGVGNGDANIIIGGGGQADFLSGLDGADFLSGGNGADLLIGGAGADQFRYRGGETGYDRITDFVAGTDKIALSGTGFVHTATIAYVSGGTPAATTTNSTFLYNLNSGILSYDADGTGAGAAVQLAQLNIGLNLTTADFLFY